MGGRDIVAGNDLILRAFILVGLSGFSDLQGLLQWVQKLNWTVPDDWALTV